MRSRRSSAVLAALLVLLALSACAAGSSAAAPSAAPTRVPTAVPTDTASPAPSPPASPALRPKAPSPTPEIPCVGMTIPEMQQTGLGRLKWVYLSTAEIDGGRDVYQIFVRRDAKYIYFRVHVHNDVVTEVEDLRNAPEPRPSGEPRPSPRPDYDNPEDFWYDNMDEFDDYDEAAEYWQEEYGDSVF